MEIEYEYSMTVRDLFARLDKKYGSIDKLRAKLAKTKKASQAHMDLEEWEYYRTSKDPRFSPDDTIQVKEAVLFHSPEEFFKFVTPARVRLLEELRSGKDYQSLRELALGLSRDPKNVYQDLKALESIRLVRLERRNRRRAVPRARVNRVHITI